MGKLDCRKASNKIKGVLSLLIIVFLFASCSESITEEEHEIVIDDEPIPDTGNGNIGAVYFAQTHVSEPDTEYFTLVGNRNTLIKVHFTSDAATAVSSPEVKAIVSLNGDEKTITLTGPSILPSYVESAPYKVAHSYEDSFTGYISKEWVKSGMTVKIETGEYVKEFNNLPISAPTVLKLNMLEIACFDNNYAQWPAGWEQEFKSRIPVTELIIKPLQSFFPEIVMQTDGDEPFKRVTSKSESKKGEKIASRWMNALQIAAGTATRTNMYYIAPSNLKMSGGRGADFHAVGFGGSIGFLGHEGGHALGLPHSNQGFYPYKAGTYNGIVQDKEWVGPSWGFCLGHDRFMPIVSSVNGKYQKTPMLGGGTSDNMDKEELLKYFSDYEVWKMKNKLEQNVVIWNSSLNSWASWNAADYDYTTAVENDGVQYPIAGDVDVVSVLTGISAVTADANIIYPPLGPYNTGLIRLFDPRNADDRADIQNIYSEHVGGFDYTIRINQGGQEKYVMIPVEHDASMDPTEGSSYVVYAVNLLDSDGEVTKVELLLTPGAEVNGLPVEETIITVWEQ